MLELTSTQKCILQIIAAIGAINWGLVAYGGSNPDKYNLVKQIFTDSEMQNYAYYAIALAGALVLYHCLIELKVL